MTDQREAVLYWCPDACGRILGEDDLEKSLGSDWREYGIVAVDDAPRPGPRVFPHEAHCRVCGCTDADCSGCVQRTGVPCHWVEPDLCSACAISRPT